MVNTSKQFLELAKDFQLGDLPTETFHKLTQNLSFLAKNNLPQALEILKLVDLQALQILNNEIKKLDLLHNSIATTIKNNHKVYLCGCGATGRLSLSLETFWRKKFAGTNLVESVVSFMAGGDTALIKSIEKFEDFPEYGAQQLSDLGFKEGDLLIACTEGGETPFVIGATEKAVELSSVKPFFLYCNPDEILCNVAKRSKRIIENSSIVKINFEIGPMALAGSTRMQASTILQLAIGLPLLSFQEEESMMKEELSLLINWYKKFDLIQIKKLVEWEAGLVKNKRHLFYQSDDNLGITILTDTTERSPTFSLLPFENQQDNSKDLSLSYLFIDGVNTSHEAWELLLNRTPRAVEWDKTKQETSLDRLYGFDISETIKENRKIKCELIKCSMNNDIINLNWKENEVNFKMHNISFLGKQTLLKMILNIHSTLIMGINDRYQNNIMTWVRPSNNKLIDRSIRYIQMLLNHNGIKKTYNEITEVCFLLKREIKDNESIVLKVVDYFKK
ncbi:MAG: SIS domain-containing protein [Bdellovibrionales bacterium]|nr:SIS domain-containing protein [Bdellovibrionales bacterium]